MISIDSGLSEILKYVLDFLGTSPMMKNIRNIKSIWVILKQAILTLPPRLAYVQGKVSQQETVNPFEIEGVIQI